jgi:hypothetical protein
MTSITYDGYSFPSAPTGIVFSSAAAVTELVAGLVRPRSVVDFGCGRGVWLAAWHRAGAERLLGLDGHWIRPDDLEVPAEWFRTTDLTQPIDVGEAFDLATSLEVAEHLPPDAADGLVDALTRTAPVVLFSAAIPFQGGTDHINEQWPAYWIERFARRGFVAVDAVRLELWGREDVAFYYQQNLVVLVDRERLAEHPALAAVHERTHGRFPALVHPVLLEHRGRQLVNWRRLLGDARAERMRDVGRRLRIAG